MPRHTTPEAILSAAHKLFDQWGAHAVTMRRVAEIVGITPMAIYRHFPNRAALLVRISDDSINALGHELQDGSETQDVVERLMLLQQPHLDYALAHPHLFDHAFSVRRDGAHRYPRDFRAGLSPTLNVAVEAIVEGMRNGVFKEDDPYAVCFTITAHQHGLIALYLAGRFSYGEAQFRKFYLESHRKLLDGIKA